MAKIRKIHDDGTAPGRAKDLDIDQYIPYQLVQCQFWMHKVVSPESEPAVAGLAELTKGEFRVLLMLFLKGALSPSEIADAAPMNRAVVTRALANLKRKRLVFAQRSEADQRSKLMALTADGLAVGERALPALRKFDAYLATAITPQEKRELLRILEKLLFSTKQYPAD